MENKKTTNDIFAQKAIAKANSAQANNSMDKASHIKKIREFLLFQKHPQTANTIATMTGLDYHAVNRRVGEMVSANMIERCGTLKKRVNGKLLSYSLYKSIWTKH